VAKSELSPVIKPSPQVVRWDITDTSAQPVHVFGHNLNFFTVFYICRSGSATVTLQASPDGNTFVTVPNSQTNLDAATTPAALKTFSLSVHSLYPVLSNPSGTINISVFVIATRP